MFLFVDGVPDLENIAKQNNCQTNLTSQHSTASENNRINFDVQRQNRKNNSRPVINRSSTTTTKTLPDILQQVVQETVGENSTSIQSLYTDAANPPPKPSRIFAKGSILSLQEDIPSSAIKTNQRQKKVDSKRHGSVA